MKILRLSYIYKQTRTKSEGIPKNYTVTKNIQKISRIMIKTSMKMNSDLNDHKYFRIWVFCSFDWFGFKKGQIIYLSA